MGVHVIQGITAYYPFQWFEGTYLRVVLLPTNVLDLCNTREYVADMAKEDFQNPTPVRLRAGQKEQLRDIAQREDRDVSWLIRKAIDEFVARYSKGKK